MPNLTISIPEDLKKQIERFPEINWSEVLRGLIAERVKKLELLKKLDKMLENSEMSEEDALKLGSKIKEGMWKKYKKEGW
jgi:hypothetical protein